MMTLRYSQQDARYGLHFQGITTPCILIKPG